MGTIVRRRLPLVLLVAGCAATVAVAVSGAASPNTGLAFAQAGHWVANSGLGLVFHVNGAAGTVDAQAQVPGIESGSRVVQGETSGYVVGSSRIIEFGKSNLSVERSVTPPSGERPVAVETAGGPYLVYRAAGTVVRLGEPAARIEAGGAVGDPVATPDGTLWLHRTDSGVLCLLRKGTGSVSCPAAVPPGHTGALTTVGDRAVFVDTSADVLRAVSPGGLSSPVPIGTDVPPTARVASADANGRVAILDPNTKRLVLVTTGDLDNGKPAAPPTTVPLSDGDYSGPTASGSAVVLLDLTRNNVLTYDNQGKNRRTTTIPKDTGQPRLSRGEDKRVYVEGNEGKHVLVVSHEGEVAQVPIIGDKKPDERTPQPPPAAPPAAPTGQPPNVPEVRAAAQPNPQAPPGNPPRTNTPRVNPPRANTPGANTPGPNVPPPPPPKPPPAVPASPPGLPPGLTATAQTVNLRVAWGAAAANGAAVTAYHVSWSPASDRGSSATQPANARSMVLTGLRPGVVYTITVVAQNSAGRGAPATTTGTVPVTQTRQVLLSRGETERYDDTCEVPACAKMHIVMRGFAPRTWYSIMPHSTHKDYENPGSSQRTDATGSLTFEAFHYGIVGTRVWVVVNGQYKSNELTWGSG